MSDALNSSTNGSRLPKLTLAALGVVYGDIGTSPLYALHQCFFGSTPLEANPENILGILSLTFWALIVIISIKYLLVIMRADNHGEGGILALLALLDPWNNPNKKLATLLITLGLFGAALLLGDGMLTPAISVLSAIEGINVAQSGLENWVVPLTLLTLLFLFSFQKKGSETIGSYFGPIMVVWFIVLAILGISQILKNPQVFNAIDPRASLHFFRDSPRTSFLALGAVFLVVTGGEALYADMGHFGARPIRFAWFGLVLPALVLNYFGQGAYLLQHMDQTGNPFYNLVPHWGVYPMVALSTVVTVIASQAVISGTFSLLRQAIQLHQSPAVQVVQTSSDEIGQIYVPFMNWILFTGTASLVIGFGSSTNLASAYGVAVSATMVITTILAFFVLHDKWRWSLPIAGGLVALFLIPDTAFFSANLIKIADGGWFPITVGAIAMLLMTTWSRGKALYKSKTSARYPSINDLLHSLTTDSVPRISGTAVFLTPPGDLVPGGLLHHLKINRVLHEQIILVTAVTKDIPRVTVHDRLEIQKLSHGFYRMHVYYGFMQSPNLPVAIALCDARKLIPNIDPNWTAYYADRATLLINKDAKDMSVWRKKLFGFMLHNSQRAVEFYKLPPGLSVELGIQVEY